MKYGKFHVDLHRKLLFMVDHLMFKEVYYNTTKFNQ